MKRFIIINAFLLMTCITSGQLELVFRPRLSTQQASDLLKTLDKKMDDSTRLNILLKLSLYNLEKLNGEKPDLDSAAVFIKDAKDINSKLLYKKEAIVIAIYESTLTRKSDDTVTARQMISNVINLLQSTNDELNLEQGYLELSRCYDFKVPEQAAEITKAYNSLIQRVPNLVNEDEKAKYIMELIAFYVLKMRGDGYPLQLDFLDHFVQACRIVKDRVNEFWVRKEIADIHLQQSKLDLAKQELFQILKEQKAGNYPRICFTYDLLSGMYIANTNYDSALYYSLETIKNVKTFEDSLYLTNFYSRVAGNYRETGSITIAIEWNLKRLNYLIAKNQTDEIFTIIYWIATDLLTLEKPKEALDLVLDNTKKYVPANNWEKRSMLLSLAKCYSALNKNELAEKYCEEVIKLHELRIRLNEITSDRRLEEFA
ncbi:MAG TPA: hypothetical protein VFU29_22050, partial [Chitinophagaceae bacterium]|nr:hypothetical protein [Chitinophagaceae bacterium]